MQLNFRESGSGTAIFLLHGLLGSASNWKPVATELAKDNRVITPDLRNHGASPHAPVMGYSDMAGDIFELMDQLGLASVVLIGHSMGGKVAMQAALQEPQRVQSLAVLDIAPISYPHSHQQIYSAMGSLDLTSLSSRVMADANLQPYIGEKAMRQFVLTNLVQRDGEFGWRVNLEALIDCEEQILDFPAGSKSGFRGPVLFLSGSESDYVGAAGIQAIMDLFPQARMQVIADAGHWLHAERPGEVVSMLQGFV